MMKHPIGYYFVVCAAIATSGLERNVCDIVDVQLMWARHQDTKIPPNSGGAPNWDTLYNVRFIEAMCLTDRRYITFNRRLISATDKPCACYWNYIHLETHIHTDSPPHFTLSFPVPSIAI